ncbi:f28eb79d-ae9f-43f4-986e-209e2e3229ac [Thermothielavioides terrestris]|uniref:F28eb79d-ae9f-43f4-986e-209e2e3229ac n=1 Tax=Thermothielavioides terrestris TaxID=2587410 RepID=A0A3S4AQ98_9PEZI|nr:f28eb79d-ae9f-43f4-986e-209e2e3229ac [Thermothielavioides terrestris]
MAKTGENFLGSITPLKHKTYDWTFKNYLVPVAPTAYLPMVQALIHDPVVSHYCMLSGQAMV